MSEVKQPQDHKAKPAEPDEYFTFTIGDTEYTMPHKTLDVITTKFVRANRRRDETDYVFTAVEELAGDGPDGELILDAIDNANRQQTKQFMKDFQTHLGAALGE